MTESMVATATSTTGTSVSQDSPSPSGGSVIASTSGGVTSYYYVVPSGETPSQTVSNITSIMGGGSVNGQSIAKANEAERQNKLQVSPQAGETWQDQARINALNKDAQAIFGQPFSKIPQPEQERLSAMLAERWGKQEQYDPSQWKYDITQDAYKDSIKETGTYGSYRLRAEKSISDIEGGKATPTSLLELQVAGGLQFGSMEAVGEQKKPEEKPPDVLGLAIGGGTPTEGRISKGTSGEVTSYYLELGENITPIQARHGVAPTLTPEYMQERLFGTPTEQPKERETFVAGTLITETPTGVAREDWIVATPDETKIREASVASVEEQLSATKKMYSEEFGLAASGDVRWEAGLGKEMGMGGGLASITDWKVEGISDIGKFKSSIASWDFYMAVGEFQKQTGLLGTAEPKVIEGGIGFFPKDFMVSGYEPTEDVKKVVKEQAALGYEATPKAAFFDGNLRIEFDLKRDYKLVPQTEFEAWKDLTANTRKLTSPVLGAAATSIIPFVGIPIAISDLYTGKQNAYSKFMGDFSSDFVLQPIALVGTWAATLPQNFRQKILVEDVGEKTLQYSSIRRIATGWEETKEKHDVFGFFPTEFEHGQMGYGAVFKPAQQTKEGYDIFTKLKSQEKGFEFGLSPIYFTSKEQYTGWQKLREEQGKEFAKEIIMAELVAGTIAIGGAWLAPTPKPQFSYSQTKISQEFPALAKGASRPKVHFPTYTETGKITVSIPEQGGAGFNWVGSNIIREAPTSIRTRIFPAGDISKLPSVVATEKGIFTDIVEGQKVRISKQFTVYEGEPSASILAPKKTSFTTGYSVRGELYGAKGIVKSSFGEFEIVEQPMLFVPKKGLPIEYNYQFIGYTSDTMSIPIKQFGVGRSMFRYPQGRGYQYSTESTLGEVITTPEYSIMRTFRGIEPSESGYTSFGLIKTQAGKPYATIRSFGKSEPQLIPLKAPEIAYTKQYQLPPASLFSVSSSGRMFPMQTIQRVKLANIATTQKGFPPITQASTKAFVGGIAIEKSIAVGSAIQKMMTYERTAPSSIILPKSMSFVVSKMSPLEKVAERGSILERVVPIERGMLLEKEAIIERTATIEKFGDVTLTKVPPIEFPDTPFITPPPATYRPPFMIGGFGGGGGDGWNIRGRRKGVKGKLRDTLGAELLGWKKRRR